MSRMVVMAVPGRLGRQFRSPFWFMAFYSLFRFPVILAFSRMHSG